MEDYEETNLGYDGVYQGAGFAIGAALDKRR